MNFVSLGEKSRRRVVYHLRDFVALDALGLRLSPDFYTFNRHQPVLVGQLVLPQGLERDAEIVSVVRFVDGGDAAEVCPAASIFECDAYCWCCFHNILCH